jgi:hypothetical protein
MEGYKMGVKHGRDYEEIHRELTVAVGRITDSYLFFEMEEEEWVQLPEEDKQEVMEALAEDLFYGLDTEPSIVVGSGIVIHDRESHRINILIGDTELAVVSLI